MDLSVNLAGLRLKNPVMTASGTFGYGLEFMPYGDLQSLGAIVVKGLSMQPREGNPMPRIAETSCGMLNAIGLQNVGAQVFVQKKLPHLPWSQTPVIANLYACDADDFAALAEYLAEQEGIAALEVNISCPNVQAGGVLFGQHAGLAGQVTRAVKAKAKNKPVIVKLSPNVADIVAIARAVAEAGADALALINTLSGMAVDLQTRRPRLANVIGGLSGPAIKPVGLRCVYQVARAVELPIIGLGGIASVDDVLEYILVGAWAVQIGTANFMRPDTAFRIVAQLPERLRELGVGRWENLRGQLRKI
jgi:dihydroorotate dehydrogenase (NAD+) catalytic subunit